RSGAEAALVPNPGDRGGGEQRARGNVEHAKARGALAELIEVQRPAVRRDRDEAVRRLTLEVEGRLDGTARGVDDPEAGDPVAILLERIDRQDEVMAIARERGLATVGPDSVIGPLERERPERAARSQLQP